MSWRVSRTREIVSFAEAFLTHPQSVGTMVPSSSLVERRLVELGGVRRARLVVELGPGTGGTTRALLSALRPDATLLCIERHPGFVSLLRTLDDPRLIVHHGSADRLMDVLAAYGLGAADVVVSGVPFSTMSTSTANLTMVGIKAALASDGCFLAYQVRGSVTTVARPLFGTPDVTSVLWNVPPVRIFRWGVPSGRAQGTSSGVPAGDGHARAHSEAPTNCRPADARRVAVSVAIRTSKLAAMIRRGKGSTRIRHWAGPRDAGARLARWTTRCARGRVGSFWGALARTTGFAATLAVGATWPGSAWGQDEPRVRVFFEGGALLQTRNDVRIPPDTGTRFSIVDLIGAAPTGVARVEVTAQLAGRHGLRVVYAPLRVSGRGAPPSEIAFAGGRFAASTPIDAEYQFDSYRATYRYRFHDGDTWRWHVGFTGFVRDARITLAQPQVTAEDSDVGFVPLAHVAGEASLGNKWLLALELDATAAPQGRAFDGAAVVSYRATPRITLGAGYRTVEGGADVDRVFNFAWLHAAVARVGVGF